MIILDTNVLSELMKPAPSARVVRWVGAQPTSSLFVTSVTQAEILYGIALMPTWRSVPLQIRIRRVSSTAPSPLFADPAC
jgi:predicted nucleic acid-binding protein